MLREFGSLCLAPVVLAGYMVATDFHFKESKHKTSVDNAQVFSAQTCEKGWGLEAKATTNGLYGGGLQYGFKFEPAQDFSLTLTPKFGVSYADRPVVELPQRTQFGLGGAIMGGYKDMRLSVELWHLSNGSALGLNTDNGSNIGMNLVLIQAGWAF